MMELSLIFFFFAGFLVVIGGIIKAHDAARKEQLEKIKQITEEFSRRNDATFRKMADDFEAAARQIRYNPSGAVNADFEVENDLPAIRKN